MPNITVYVVTNWHNAPVKDSPLSATNLNHIETGVKNATNFINTLNAEAGLYLCQVPFTTALKTKLDGIENNANKYVLPVATEQSLGGVKPDGTTVFITNAGVLSADVRTHISELTDVELTDIQDGQILRYDATAHKWVNANDVEFVAELSHLNDVQINDLVSGQTLEWDSTLQKWVNTNYDATTILDYYDTLRLLGMPADTVYGFKLATLPMTSNNQPLGTVTTSGDVSGSNPGWKAFDGNATASQNGWISSDGEDQINWINFNFWVPKAIWKFDLVNYIHSDVHAPGAFKLQGSNDGTNYEDIQSYTVTDDTSGAVSSFDVDNPTVYINYRLYFTGKQNVALTEIRLYERYEK